MLRKHKRQIIKQKLFQKRRLIIQDEESFEEIFSLQLNFMNIFISIVLVSIFWISFTIAIIFFTPLREFIPGYTSNKVKKQAVELAFKVDSLATVIKNNETYLHSVKRVLTNDLDYAKFSKDSILLQKTTSKTDLSPSQAELKLRAEISKEEARKKGASKKKR